MSVKDKLISNTLYLFIDWFALSIIGFLYWFVAGKTLLPEEYGIVSTTVNLAIILGGLSLLGLHAAVWKLIPEYLAKGQKYKVNSLIRFSLKAIVLSNSFIILILFFLSPVISPVLKIPLNVILVSGLILFCYSIATHFGYIIYGFQNMKKLAITDFIGQLSKIIVSVSLILLGFRYFGPIIGFLVGYITIILLRINSIPLRDKVAKINKKLIMFNYALPAFISMAAWLVFTNGQYVLLTSLKNPETTGIFAIAMILTSMLTIIPAIIINALLPIISQLSAKRDTEKRQSYLIGLVFRYSLLITLPLAVVLLLFSDTAILLFSRAEYLPSAQLFPILIIGSLIYGIGNNFLGSIYAIGQTKVNRNIVIFVTLIFLLLAFPLIYLFSSFGSALAYSISVMVLTLLSFFYVRKFLKLTLPWSSVWKLAVAILISFGFLYTAMTFLQGLLTGVIFASISILIYIIILLPLKFYTIEDIKILDFISEKTPILKKEVIMIRDYLLRFVENFN